MTSSIYIKQVSIPVGMRTTRLPTVYASVATRYQHQLGEGSSSEQISLAGPEGQAGPCTMGSHIQRGKPGRGIPV